MTTELSNLKFTVRPSRFDYRDFLYKNPSRRQVDLREWDSAVESQNDLGSCVGNAIANAYELILKKSYPEKYTELSKLFIYYNSRYLEGTTSQDVGSYVRSGLAAVKKYGVPAEMLWPYEIEKFNVKPSDESYSDAGLRTIDTYRRLVSRQDVIESINDNTPVVVGLEIFDGFLTLSKDDPIVKMPTETDKSLGGHAMTIVGYDLDKEMFLVKNSFGTDWGMDGYCWVPFSYIDYYAWELWNFTIKLT